MHRARTSSRELRKNGVVATLAVAALAIFAGTPAARAGHEESPRKVVYRQQPPAPREQSQAQADAKSLGCRSCHLVTDRPTMHASTAVVLGCTDCHGGDPAVVVPAGAARGSESYLGALTRAHVLPRYPDAWNWPASRLPEHSYTLLNREAPEFIRFMNPGDLRVAREACGACHSAIVETVERSLMATTAMLWGGASYNNGILPYKRYILGEAYTRDGLPASILGVPGDDSPDGIRRGYLSRLWPLPAWETVPPADNFRVFERGGRSVRSQFPEIGLPNRLEEPGRPDLRQSNRGPGTGSRISVPVLNIHKTRLNDPTLWFLGTNDQPGDYRSSGCTACHVVYANDRDPLHAGPLAQFGNRGETQTVDVTVPRGEPGHPLAHELTRAIPTSQCMICHMHQPNMFVNSYLGYTMWDYEADAPLMWPAEQRYPTIEETLAVHQRNPEGAAPRGNWADPEFLRNVRDLNPRARATQFADYHGHGWNFRAVFKRDRSGNLLDAGGTVVSEEDPRKFSRAVQLRDIHAEKGMQCVDCHFSRDAHGTGHLVGEVAAAVEIDCRDCHGTVDAHATLRSSGPASPTGGTPLGAIRNADGRKRFEWRRGALYQRSTAWPDREWRVPQVKDSVTPGDARYNAKAARAKTLARRGKESTGIAPAREDRAHDDRDMACFACHSSWVTSCAGCHLPIEANRKTERHHYEGGETRNYATYNPQVAREEMFLLGRHGEVKGGIIVPLRSSSALVVSSTDINRGHIYVQQPPVSAAGFSSQAFNPHFPHTVRKTETKGCEDCHLSERGDNNAIMAQLLGLGTSFVNFIGFHAWVGTESTVEAIQVTEWEEPQAVIGSYLHRYSYPDRWREHVGRDRRLAPDETGSSKQAQASGRVGCLQLRGEYLYVAGGDDGLQVYDVASIANKNVSERILAGPFSPLGHDTRVDTKRATCVALPTNQPIRPELNGGPQDPERDRLMRQANLEQRMHPVYRYAAVTDAVEGLILVDVTTMGDFEPRNNFLERALTWNPGGLLDGAKHATFAGHILYVAADAGVVVIDLDDPLAPRHLATIALSDSRQAIVQFRYLFVLDAQGLAVVDVTHPERPRLVPDARVMLSDARGLFVARTYAYVAAGRDGLVVVDVERPEEPRVELRFDAGGTMVDATDVAVASTNASLFAYVADGRAGLKVVQLTSPESGSRLYGFSPVPAPELIAWHSTDAPALSVSRGLERDRAVDETGHQVAVFGRVGSRPFSLEEMQHLFLDQAGRPWFVAD
jgi:hypothetical protein